MFSLNYQQEYIDSLWCELQIPPDAKGNFKLNENHLHIWPRQTFMFIAIPSLVSGMMPLLRLLCPRCLIADRYVGQIIHVYIVHAGGDV